MGHITFISGATLLLQDGVNLLSLIIEFSPPITMVYETQAYACEFASKKKTLGMNIYTICIIWMDLIKESQKYFKCAQILYPRGQGLHISRYKVFLSVGRFKVLKRFFGKVHVKFNSLGVEVHNFVITKIRTEIRFGCWNQPLARLLLIVQLRLGLGYSLLLKKFRLFSYSIVFFFFKCQSNALLFKLEFLVLIGCT